MADSSTTDEVTTNRGPVDVVIDQLDRRIIPQPDRSRLRKALDTADAPLGGRAGADEALKRITA